MRVKYIKKFAVYILLINLIGIYCNYNIVCLDRVLNMFYKVTKVSVIILIEIVNFPWKSKSMSKKAEDYKGGEFAEACRLYAASIGKESLSKQEKQLVSRNMIRNQSINNTLDNDEKIRSMKVLTAYSDNYRTGDLCSVINSHYCRLHNYLFLLHVHSNGLMNELVAPRKHLGWYKVRMIYEELESELAQDANINDLGASYLFWIDADAIFVDFDTDIETYIRRGRFKNLIVGEDMTPCCEINSGVMLIKVNEWSLEFWKEVWNCVPYYARPFFDQSAVLKCLRRRKEGLTLFNPFHTFLPGVFQDDKFFANTAVLPHLDFNTNIGFVTDTRKVQRKFNRAKEKIKLREQKLARESTIDCATREDQNQLSADVEIEPLDSPVVCGSSSTEAVVTGPGEGDCSSVPITDSTKSGEERAKFIFHACGRCDKFNTLRRVAMSLRIDGLDLSAFD